MGMRFSPHKNNSNVTCCVFGCRSISKTEPTVRFHPFPNAGESHVTIINKFNEHEVVDRRYAWEKVLKMKKYSPTARVCSLHFSKDDYIMPDIPAKVRRLKKSAVPSINLPDIEPVTEATLKRKENNDRRTKRLINRCLQKMHDSMITKKSSNMSESESVENKKNETFENEQDEAANNVQNETVEKERYEIGENMNNVVDDGYYAAIEPPVLLHQEKAVQTPRGEYQDKEVQVEFELYSNFIKSAKDLNTITGLPTFEHLYFLENVVKVVSPKLAFSYSKSWSKLSLKDNRIVLTFFKLKQNVSYGILSVMFQVYTEENCRKIFLRMIEILSAGLKCFIYWPDKEEILKNIPECFHDFTNVRAVIDVIEINIQSPKKLCCRLASYSSYKSAYTIRFMTAVTPAGLISYISDAYLGRSSDKAIFEQSDFIKLFEEGDGLMTDKGFLIDEICLKHGVTLVRPPFLRDKKQFSREEALLNAKIAKARVHIERSNHPGRKLRL